MKKKKNKTQKRLIKCRRRHYSADRAYRYIGTSDASVHDYFIPEAEALDQMSQNAACDVADSQRLVCTMREIIQCDLNTMPYTIWSYISGGIFLFFFKWFSTCIMTYNVYVCVSIILKNLS